MPFPAGLTLVTVAVRADLLPSGGAAGTVRISYGGPLTGATDNSIVPYVDVTASLDADGEAELELPATNDPGWVPADFAYTVVTTFGAVTHRGTLQLDYQTTSVQLADLIQWDGAAAAGTTYATLAQLTTHEADTTAVHGIANTTALIVEGDARLTNARTPTAHASSHADGGTDEVSLDGSQITSGTVPFARLPIGTSSSTVAAGDAPGAAQTAAIAAAAALVDDLSGVSSASTARTNLGLGGAAVLSVGTTAGTVAAGDDSRIVAANTGLVRAADHSLVGWTYDPALVQSGTVLATGGLAYVARVQVLTGVVTNIHFHFTAGGSSLTSGQCFAALYNDAGALLGAGAVTADQAANWGSGGFKTCALSVAQGVTQYAWYRVLWWFNGTTGPTLSRACNSSSAIVNAGLSSSFRYATADSSLTTTAPGNIGTMTGGATAWWVGLS